MLDNQIITDITAYVLGNIGYVQFRADGEYRRARITDKRIISSGVVRVVALISTAGVSEIDRVELYSVGDRLWSFHDIVITVAATQTDIVFWFDVDVKNITEDVTE